MNNFRHSFLRILLISCTAIFCNAKGQAQASTPQAISSDIIADLLSRDAFMMYHTPGVTALHYAEVCTAYGALRIAGHLKDTELLEKIRKRYDRITTEKVPNTENHVDANVYGILPIEIYRHTENKAYLAQGLYLADLQWRDTIEGGLSAQTRFWIDDMYMIGCLQVQAYRATGDMKYLDRAALELNAYISKLQQPNGLFHHGPEAPFYWGRGNGWVAAGIAELLSELPSDHLYYEPILSGYVKMMNTLLAFQSKDGMWHQLLDRPDSFVETSCTAMFGYAMSVGVNKGLLPNELFGKAYRKAWNALTQYVDPDGKIGEVCVGTGQSLDATYYYERPRVRGDFHGQAPMLWLALAMMEGEEKY